MQTVLNDRPALGWLTSTLAGLFAGPVPRSKEPADPLEREPLNENTYAGAYDAHNAMAALHAPLLEFLERVARALRNEGFVVGAPQRDMDAPSLSLAWICGFGTTEEQSEEGDLVLGLSLQTDEAPAGAAANHAARHDVYVGLGYLQTNENLVGERLEDAPHKSSVPRPAPEPRVSVSLKERIARVQAQLAAADEAALAASFARALDR